MPFSMTSRSNPNGQVSVCIPTVARTDLLREAIASVAAQTYRNFEIVIADNSAERDSQQRIDQLLAGFPELKFVLKRHPTRLSIPDNFNSLIDAASGGLWVLLPDDDRLSPNFLARSVAALDAHPECIFTFADHWIIGADGGRDADASRANSILYSRHLLREGVYRHDQLFGIVLKQSICLQTSMFRRQAISSFRFAPGINLVDQSLFMRIGASREPLHAYYLDERLFEYRIHGAQVTSTMKREAWLRDQIALFEHITDVPVAHRRAFDAMLGRYYLSLAFLEAEQKARGPARAYAVRALRLNRDLRTTLGTLLVSAAPFAVPFVRRVGARVKSGIRL
jgi:glycosyltransferase involved in cell wall biosynthesis